MLSSPLLGCCYLSEQTAIVSAALMRVYIMFDACDSVLTVAFMLSTKKFTHGECGEYWALLEADDLKER